MLDDSLISTEIVTSVPILHIKKIQGVNLFVCTPVSSLKVRQCSLKLKQNIGKYEFYVLTRTNVTSLYNAAMFRNFWEANFSCCHMVVIFMVINKCIYCDVSRAVLVISWHSYIFKPTKTYWPLPFKTNK